MLLDYEGGTFVCNYDKKLAEKVAKRLKDVCGRSQKPSVPELLSEAWASATIEGADATREEVMDAYHTITLGEQLQDWASSATRVEQYEDREKVVEAFYSVPLGKGARMGANCLNTMKKATLSHIRVWDYGKRANYVWRELTNGVCDNTSVGFDEETGYRKGMVYVGSHIPAEPKDIPACMDSLWDYLDQSNDNFVVKAAVAHFYVGYVHPFCDGNGRFARFLSSWFLCEDLLSLKVFQLPFSVFILNSQQSYYNTYAESEVTVDGVKDIAPFVNYILKAFDKTLQTSGQKFSENELKVLDLFREGSYTEITAARLGEAIGVTKGTATRILHDLSRRELLTIHKTDNDFYCTKGSLF